MIRKIHHILRKKCHTISHYGIAFPILYQLSGLLAMSHHLPVVGYEKRLYPTINHYEFLLSTMYITLYNHYMKTTSAYSP